MRKSRCTKSQGTVITECAIALPAIIFILSGLVEISRVLNELTWATNSAYQLASVLGGNQKSRAREMMQDRMRQISDHYRKSEFSKVGISVGAPRAPSAGGFDADFFHPSSKVVGVTFTASVKPLGLSSFTFPVSLNAVAPYLIEDVDTSDFSSPRNVGNVDCQGNKCTGSGCPACCDYSLNPASPTNVMSPLLCP